MKFLQAMAAVAGGARVSYAAAADPASPVGFLTVWYADPATGEILLDAYGQDEEGGPWRKTQEGVRGWSAGRDEQLRRDWLVVP